MENHFLPFWPEKESKLVRRSYLLRAGGLFHIQEKQLISSHSPLYNCYVINMKSEFLILYNYDFFGEQSLACTVVNRN